MLKLIRENLFILGLFFLIWATNAYFIFGNPGKYISLFIGFFFIVKAALNEKITNHDFRFFLSSFFVYLIYIFIAIIQAQKTLTLLNLAFGFVCFVLLNVGFVLGKHNYKLPKINPKLTLVFLIIIIISLVFVFKQQIEMRIISNSRDLGDKELNGIGIAYIESLLFLFVFWLWHNNLQKAIKLIAIITLTGIAIVMFATGSRGALIYLSFFLLLFFLKGQKLAKVKKKTIIKSLFSLGLVTIVIINLFEKSVFIKDKLDFLIVRFNLLWNFLTNNGTDLSSQDRIGFYQNFSKNWIEYIFGQVGYTPYPHNQFMEIFMRWGLFGVPLIIFSLFIFINAYKQINRKKFLKEPFLFLIVGVFFFSYLQSMSSMSLEMNRTMWLGFGYLWGLKIKGYI